MTTDEVSRRKSEHLALAATAESQTGISAGWEEVHLIPATMPEASIADIDLTTTLVGHALAAPIVISAMTGGHEHAVPINRALASAAQAIGVAIGSGSQRAAVDHPDLAHTYRVLRQEAPDAVIIANIGISQLVPQGGTPPLTDAELGSVVEMLDAQLLAVHLNVIEELVQTEGDKSTDGYLEALERTVAVSPVPVIAKETGSGISAEAARLLSEVGVSAIDVGGAGGTSFARIEAMRAAAHGDTRGARIGATFGDWGVPTALSVLECLPAGLPVIATGGIRSGLDAAKALALGAVVVGVGHPALVAAEAGYDELFDWLTLFLDELRLAMLLTGSTTPRALRSITPVLTGSVAAWATQRGLVPGPSEHHGVDPESLV